MMDGNAAHLWIPALKDLGSLLLPVMIMGVMIQQGDQTRETI